MASTLCAFITALGTLAVGHCDLGGTRDVPVLANAKMEYYTTSMVWTPMPGESGLEIRAEPGIGYFRRCGTVVMMAAGIDGPTIMPVWLPSCAQS